jgi:Kef-type K+ transport system membrane component KefB
VSRLSGADVAEFVAVTVVACAGKLGGAVAGARLRHVEWRRSLAIGALMNTRGLIELVVLTIGFEHGVLDRSLFTILVLMAVVTTLLTAPALRLIYRDDAPPHTWDSHDVAAVTAVAGGQP